MAKRHHPTPSHQDLLNRIRSAVARPTDDASFDEWLTARSHIDVIAQNSTESELIVCAYANSFWVDTAIVARPQLAEVDQTDLLQWRSSLGYGVGYSISDDDGPITIECGSTFGGSKLLRTATRLVYPRDFVGLKTDDSYYMEASQAYIHLSDCHWRPERRAYCRFDENGDFDPIISVSVRDQGVTLVSFARRDLEEYLAASDSRLVRLFDFTLVHPDRVSGMWRGSAPRIVNDSNPDLVFEQSVFPGCGSHARGYQFVYESPRAKTWARQRKRWKRGGTEEGVAFWADDFRNGMVAEISTRPDATVNYFNSKGTTRPFETSPAFFRPEVLHRYTADPDKYTVKDRDISCRATWSLRYGVNEADQVFAYICDLRNLPDSEQYYWKGFNEKPKAGLPDDVVKPDFHGEYPSKDPPLSRIRHILRRWNREGPRWWKVRDQMVLDALRVPRSDSRHEWASAFQALDKAVVEGFCARPIRRLLESCRVECGKKDQSIMLLKKAISASDVTFTDGESSRLEGLEVAHKIRNKVAAHAGGSEAETLKRNALEEFGTFSKHFEDMCERIANELVAVNDALEQLSQAV